MKKLFIQSFVAAICLFAGKTLSAQDTLEVDPGLGTLESAWCGFHWP